MRVLASSTAQNWRHRLLRPEQNHSPRLAPDGSQFVYIKSAGNGQELWLRHGVDDRRLSAFPGGTVSDVRWTADGARILYRHAEHGREIWRLGGIQVGDLSPAVVQDPALGGDYWLSDSDPIVVFAAREKDTPWPGLFRLDLNQAPDVPVRVAANPGFHRWLVDRQLRPRGGIRLGADGSAAVMLGDSPDNARVVLPVAADSLADFSVLRFSRDGTRLFLISSTGGRSRRLLAVTADGTVSTVFEHSSLDLDGYPVAPDGVWFHPVSGEPDICSVMDQRLEYRFRTPVSSRTAAYLTAEPGRSRVLVDRSADDQTWLIAEVHDNGPMLQYPYEPATGRSGPVLLNRPDLAGAMLSSLQDFCFDASDGMRIHGYAMQPLYGGAPYPTVLLVHGGPAGRDTWRFNAEAQYLASLGFLSLHVNYRGSRGFGTAFRQAGNGEWGGLMQQDLHDAVAHGVAVGLVDPDRVSFMGSSYGGYAALLAACTKPDAVRCAVAISPLCDLISFATTPPKFWSPLAGSLFRQMTRRSDGQTVDRAALERCSPAHILGTSCAPVLIAHGARDPRVPVADIDAFTQRASELGVPVRYLRFPDEGHLVKSAENRGVLFTEIQAFLEQYSARD